MIHTTAEYLKLRDRLESLLEGCLPGEESLDDWDRGILREVKTWLWDGGVLDEGKVEELERIHGRLTGRRDK
jgi:hypothetical protein